MVITILGWLISGLLATVVTLIVTDIQKKRHEKRNYQLQLFKDLIAYRGDIAGGLPTGNFQKAINQIFIAYNKCPEVIKAFEAVRKSTLYRSNNPAKDNDKIIDNLVLLLKAMATEIGVDYSFSNDDLFTKPVLIGSPVVPVFHPIQKQETEERH